MRSQNLLETFIKNLLSEGGAVGHLSHVYDDPDMTFAEMKSILSAAAEGRLQNVTEKLDGMNLVFTWNAKTAELKVARNSGDIVRGGMSAEQLATKFYGRENIEDAFNSAFSVLSSAMQSLSSTETRMIFGDAMNRWYSVEVIYAKNPNVIQYDTNTVVFHQWPIFEVQADGTVQQTDDASGVKLLADKVDRMQKAIKIADWRVSGPVIVNLKRMSDGTVLAQAIAGIDSALSSVGLDDSSTVQEYTMAALRKQLSQRNFSPDIAEMIIKKILKIPGAPNILQLKKMDPVNAIKIEGAVNEGPSLLKIVKYPIEKSISDFAVKVLECLESSLIGNNQQEILRLRAATQNAIDALQSGGNPAALDFLKMQLSKLGNINAITSAVEGVVFIYKGNAMKFTGSFAAANQILGFFKYGRG